MQFWYWSNLSLSYGPKEAERWFLKATELFMEIKSMENLVDSKTRLGSVYAELGIKNRHLIDKGLDELNEALELGKEVGYKKGEADAIKSIGIAYEYLGDVTEEVSYYKKAEEFYKEAFRISRSIKDELGEGDAHSCLGYLYRKLKRKKWNFII